LKVATKKNTIEKNTWAQELENKYFRKITVRRCDENTFSEVTYKFPKKIHSVTVAGCLLKILIAIITFILHKHFE
jgi:hypothetical protein